MADLALQVGKVNRIGIGDYKFSDPRGTDIQSNGTPQSTGTDNQNRCVIEFLLALDTDLRQKNMPAIAEQLLIIHWVLAARICG
jgi:hypothetical protein